MDFHGDPMIFVMICKFGAMGMVRSMGLYGIFPYPKYPDPPNWLF